MRTFLAIKVNPNRAIQSFYNAVKKTKGDLKPVKLEQLHITLKFFGEIQKDMLEKITDVVRSSTTHVCSFSFDMAGCGAFPNMNYLRVIWLGLKNHERLLSLGNQLQESFEELGFKKEKFTPHLTIFRIKSAKNKKKILEVLEEYKNTSFGSVKVNQLLLMESTLTQKGPIYSVLQRFELER